MYPICYKIYEKEIERFFEERNYTRTSGEPFVLSLVSDPGMGKTIFIKKFCEYFCLNYKVINISKNFYHKAPYNTNTLVIDEFYPTDKNIAKFNEYANDVKLEYEIKGSSQLLDVEFMPLISNFDIDYVENNVTPIYFKTFKRRINVKFSLTLETNCTVINMKSYDRGNFGRLVFEQRYHLQTRYIDFSDKEVLKVIIDMMLDNYRVNRMTNTKFYEKLQNALRRIEEELAQLENQNN